MFKLRRNNSTSAAMFAVATTLVACLTLQPVAVSSESEEASAGLKVHMVVPDARKTVISTAKPKPGAAGSSNPWLSFLPKETNPDFDAWKQRLQAAAVQRAAERNQRELAQFQINQSEAEGAGVKGLNDTINDAEVVVGFGTGNGEDPSADIDGTLRVVPAPNVVAAGTEDDGQISLATLTGVGDGDSAMVSATIGDGPFGSSQQNPIVATDLDSEDDGSITLANDTMMVPFDWITEEGNIGDGPQGSGGTATGDWDYYKVTISGRQVVDVTVTETDAQFRPVLAIYAADGTLLDVFDDIPFGSAGFIRLLLELTGSGGPVDFLFAVGGNIDFDGNPSDELQSDPFSSSTGAGVGSEGDYAIDIQFLPPGDFDFFSFSGIAGDFVTMEVDTDDYNGVLDPIVGVFDSAGMLLAFNDDGAGQGSEPFDSFLSFTVPLDGDYYVAVGGFNEAVFPTSPVSFPADANDSSSGPGVGSEGAYDLIVSRNTLDIDVFSMNVAAGDVIGMNVTGSAPFMFLFDPAGDLLIGSSDNFASGLFPPSSPLPGGGVATHAVVATDTGPHYAMLFGGLGGAYTLELRGFRPPAEASGSLQRLFIDFDGATMDTTIYDSEDGIEGAVLSPLSAFLIDWGLQPSDESSVIDAILAEVERVLKDDLQANGENADFDIEILNSRDHPDPFGDPDVSRIIVGGTIAESGISTIGIAESVDPGNFDQDETALVLLDLLSDPDTTNPNSLNQYGLSGGATKIELVGKGVGSIVAHEAGHFFANFHTDNTNLLPNIMDTGGNLSGILGIGGDGLFGSGDDVAVFFENDTYDPAEGYLGTEDTKNSIAWALFKAPPTQSFNDVAPEDFAFSFIETLFASGVTSGCGNGNFCPSNAVTRAQMAVFLLRGRNGSGFVPPPATGVFADVPASSFAIDWIEQLAADGITSGCGGGNYCPNNPVTRAQMAVFLLRGKYGSGYTPPPATGVFADVSASNFAIDWIEQLAAEGITAGCGGGNYCPNDPVTRAQMAVFLVRAFEL